MPTVTTFPSQTFASYGVNGPLGGGQIGYNYQMGWVVAGIEAQWSWANLTGSDSCTALPGVNVPVTCRTTVDSLGTAAIRLGSTINHALLYVKGGVAWADDKHETAGRFGLADGSILAASPQASKWVLGYMLGGGVEYAFTPNWSGKMEYNYMDLGQDSYSFLVTSTTGAATNRYDIDIHQRLHVIKFGINYHFGSSAIVAKY